MHEVFKIFKATRFSNLMDEKTIQAEIFIHLEPLGFEREYRLSKGSIVDFYRPLDGLAIEVKVKGSPMRIYEQLERYCKFDQVRSILLVTNKSMGLPEEINGKQAYVASLGEAWL